MHRWEIEYPQLSSKIGNGLLRHGNLRWANFFGSVGYQRITELRMKLAGFPIVLQDAPAQLSTTVSASNWHYGSVCMDLLNRAAEVTLDFVAMRIELK